MSPDTQAPLVVESADAVAWQDSADVIVVGFGAAGAAAALQTHEQVAAADVLVIDRFEGGGATAFSGGVVYVGGTRYQRGAGYEDNAAEMYKYLRLEVGDAVSDETLRRFCETSNDNLEWLEQHGVRFGSTLHEGKASYPPPGKFLYYSGNEKVAKYRAVAKPAPRGHRTVGKGLSGGPFFAALRESVEQAGIRTMRHARVRRLVCDAEGRILGVAVDIVTNGAAHQSLYRKVTPMLPFQGRRAEKAIAQCEAFESGHGERKLIRARHGVVLATGGFTYNVPMLKQYTRKTYFDNCLGMFRLGSMGCAGDGIHLGQSVGAATEKMDSVLVARSIVPPAAAVEGVMVNREGRRFINEDTYLGFLGDAISRQPEGQAWLLFESATFWKLLRQMLPNGDGSFVAFKLSGLINTLFGGTRRAATLDALARKCGIDALGLEREIAEFNAVARRGSGDSQGKVDAYLRPLKNGPYYAINMTLANPFATTLTFTLGGLKVNESTSAVQRADGSDIDGLYAVGRTAVGVCSNAYFSGMSLTDCIFSGRRAGAAIAAKMAAELIVPR